MNWRRSTYKRPNKLVPFKLDCGCTGCIAVPTLKFDTGFAAADLSRDRRLAVFWQNGVDVLGAGVEHDGFVIAFNVFTLLRQK